ncbi:hypothetical protein BIV23_14410 [Streptomyces monashensis]|uniref:SCP domain-containing protein n=1 Tax=Streptomyces monashensis TaxID=1678012 RepID=A0A1S2QHP6_9ACTN|nr:hypothetical protein BIV23_14410 [Streptomyces monashensis]
MSCAPPAWAGPAAPSSPAWGDDVVSALNRLRAEAGCAAVRPRVSLRRAARAHTSDMAAHRHLTHTGTDGSAPQDRMRTAGYRPVATGETIEVGPADAGAAVAAWMAGPPHRAILLTCRYTDAGTGVADGPDGTWWTLVPASHG